MICYLIKSLADWPGIGTCIPTAFFVALGTVGETRHKAMLRILGCLIGAALGLGAILLLMPQMTDLGDLLLLLAPVTLLAAWVGSGSERIAYAGWQIGLAFYLIVLQGFGPTLDMEPAKDRTIGILLGNIVIFVIFTTIWPVSVADVVRTNVAKALEQLAKLTGLGARADGEIPQAARSAAGTAFGQAIARARAVLVNDPLETRAARRAARRSIDATVVEQIGRLFIPVTMILDLLADPAGHELPQSTRNAICAHHEALAAWFGQALSWVHSGEGADKVLGGLPGPPIHPAPVITSQPSRPGMGCCTRTFSKFSTKSVRSRRSRGRLGAHPMRLARLRLIAVAGCALLGACNDTSNLAPASPDTPWQAQSADEAAPPPALTTAPRQFTVPPDTVAQSPSSSGIDANQVYSLVELIDIAQSRNPATRVAWDQARQAAIGVGISRAAYLPALTASALGGYQGLVAPFPNTRGFITSNSAEVIPQLGVTYLLLDFGGCAAASEEAGQRSIAANAAFTAANQLLIFNVARAYFTVDGSDALVNAAQQALATHRCCNNPPRHCTVVASQPSSTSSSPVAERRRRSSICQRPRLGSTTRCMLCSWPWTCPRPPSCASRTLSSAHCRRAFPALSTKCSARRCTAGQICWPTWRSCARRMQTLRRPAPRWLPP